MKIVVCIKEAIDPSLNIGFGMINEELLRKGLAFKLNPNDAEALTKALIFKQGNTGLHTEIIILSIGPKRVEEYLRNGLALGADRAVRIWGQELENLSSFQKAKVLSKAIALFNADLILTGGASIDIASSQIGPLVAAMLGLPCICEATEFQFGHDSKNISVHRNIGRGVQEKVSSTLPLVLTMEGQGNNLPYALLDKILEGISAQVSLLSLSDLEISYTELKASPIRISRLSHPRPRPKKIPTPESSLPAFERILALLQGGISKRQGKILDGDSDELVNQIYQQFVEKDIIKLPT